MRGLLLEKYNSEVELTREERYFSFGIVNLTLVYVKNRCAYYASF